MYRSILCTNMNRAIWNRLNFLHLILTIFHQVSCGHLHFYVYRFPRVESNSLFILIGLRPFKQKSCNTYPKSSQISWTSHCIRQILPLVTFPFPILVSIDQIYKTIRDRSCVLYLVGIILEATKYIFIILYLMFQSDNYECCFKELFNQRKDY